MDRLDIINSHYDGINVGCVGANGKDMVKWYSRFFFLVT